METPAQDFPRPINRKVWVLNDWRDDYTRDFKGDLITIPAKGQKKVLLPLLEAEFLLGLGKPPAQFAPDGSLVKGSPPPQMLRIAELTPDEVDQFEGGVAKREQKQKEETEKAKAECQICGGQFQPAGLKAHVTKMHPEYEVK